MIDCSKTENYFAEKQRMTKKHKLNFDDKSCTTGIKHWLESEAEE